MSSSRGNGDGDKRKKAQPPSFLLSSCPRLTSCSPEFVHAPPPCNLRFIDERLLGSVKGSDSSEGEKDKLALFTATLEETIRDEIFIVARLSGSVPEYTVNLHLSPVIFFPPPRSFVPDEKKEFQFSRFHVAASPRLALRGEETRDNRKISFNGCTAIDACHRDI